MRRKAQMAFLKKKSPKWSLLLEEEEPEVVFKKFFSKRSLCVSL